MSFKNEFREHVMNTLAGLQKINAEIEKFKASESNYSKEYATECFKEFESKKFALISESNRKANELVGSYKKQVHEEFATKGEDLTEDAKLLSSGINFTAAELDELAEKHAGNRTMERLIYDFADRNGIIMYNKRPTESDKLELADSLMNWHRSVTQRPEYADIWTSDDYFNEAFGEE